jgi:hypothetical protein
MCLFNAYITTYLLIITEPVHKHNLTALLSLKFFMSLGKKEAVWTCGK